MHLATAHQILIRSEAAIEKRMQNVIVPKENAQRLLSTPAERKSFLIRCLTLWLCTDLQAFHLVDQTGFHDFLMKYNIVQDKSEIPSARAILNSGLDDVHCTVQKFTFQALKASPKVMTLITDMWTAQHTSVPYITIYVRFLDDNLELRIVALNTFVLPSPHTAVNIGRAIRETLRNCGLTDRRFIGVADHARNISKAFSLMDEILVFLGCKAHAIHSCLTADFEKKEVEHLWKAIKELLAKLKRIHGILVYKLPQIKERYMARQVPNFLQFLEVVENVIEELDVDERIEYFPVTPEEAETEEMSNNDNAIARDIDMTLNGNSDELQRQHQSAYDEDPTEYMTQDLDPNLFGFATLNDIHNDAEAEEIVKACYEEFSKDIREPRKLSKSNVTRWFSTSKMIKTTLENLGK